MQYISSIRAAVKGKAPIVAVPVEGFAPACVDRRRLAAWCKGVDVRSASIETSYQYTAPHICPMDRERSERDFIGPLHRHERPKYREPEGPQERSIGSRVLLLEGTAGRVKTRCRMVVIDRRTAVKTLSVWSEKERARLLKKTMLGVLATTQKRALKLAAHGDAEGAGAVTIQAALKGRTVAVTGVPVVLPGFEDTEFIIHRSIDKDGAALDDAWTVTERYTGMSAGSASTAENALVEARNNIRKATLAGRAKVLDQIRAAKLAALAVAA